MEELWISSYYHHYQSSHINQNMSLQYPEQIYITWTQSYFYKVEGIIRRSFDRYHYHGLILLYLIKVWKWSKYVRASAISGRAWPWWKWWIWSDVCPQIQIYHSSLIILILKVYFMLILNKTLCLVVSSNPPN